MTRTLLALALLLAAPAARADDDNAIGVTVARPNNRQAVLTLAAPSANGAYFTEPGVSEVRLVSQGWTCFSQVRLTGSGGYGPLKDRLTRDMQAGLADIPGIERYTSNLVHNRLRALLREHAGDAPVQFFTSYANSGASTYWCGQRTGSSGSSEGWRVESIDVTLQPPSSLTGEIRRSWPEDPNGTCFTDAELAAMKAAVLATAQVIEDAYQAQCP